LAAASRPHGRSLLTVISVTILIGAEVFGVALAAAWALAGIFELGETVGYILMGLFGLAGLYVLVGLWRRALAVESGR
jgi:hypothetical protein